MDTPSEKPAKERIKLHKKFHNEVMRWLRKAFSWSGIQTMVKSRARIRRGVYGCEYCGKEVGPKQFDIDHLKPCVAIEDNWTTGYSYSEIVENMFDMENSFLVCKPCHKSKTGKENSERKTGVPLRPTHKKKLKDYWNKPEMKEFASRRHKGRKLTEEHKNKLSKSKSGKGSHQFGKRGFDSHNSRGIWVTEKGSFGSMELAAEANNLSTTGIRSRCLKVRNKKPMSKNFLEKYKNWKFIPKNRE